MINIWFTLDYQTVKVFHLYFHYKTKTSNLFCNDLPKLNFDTQIAPILSVFSPSTTLFRRNYFSKILLVICTVEIAFWGEPSMSLSE